MLDRFLDSADLAEQLQILAQSLPMGIWETIYSTFLVHSAGLCDRSASGRDSGHRGSRRNPASARRADEGAQLCHQHSALRTLPDSDDDGHSPLPPYHGHQRGHHGPDRPLVIAAFPFVARWWRAPAGGDKGILEAAQSMGCSPFQIVWKVLLPECLPSLITGFTTAFITILSYGAMAGIIGGGGLGAIAINYGYYRRKVLVMVVAVVILVILVQIFQTLGTHFAVALDRRISRNGKKSARRARRSTADKAGLS